jgi:putative transposase
LNRALLRIIKLEYMYLNIEETVSELRDGIRRFIKYYNCQRQHQSLSSICLSLNTI